MPGLQLPLLMGTDFTQGLDPLLGLQWWLVPLGTSNSTKHKFREMHCSLSINALPKFK